MCSEGFRISGGSFNMALHKKHRVAIALGNNSDDNGIFCFHLEKCDPSLVKQDYDRATERINECNVALLW